MVDRDRLRGARNLVVAQLVHGRPVATRNEVTYRSTVSRIEEAWPG
jgi:hypothetical protein